MAKELPSTFFKVLGTVNGPPVLEIGLKRQADTLYVDLLSSCDITLDHGGGTDSEESCHGRYVFCPLFERLGREERASREELS
jgi:hypothetical protein